MAAILKRWKAFLKTPPGRLLEALCYAALLALILIYFTGNGQFIYEAV
ncbi:MAG: hypothetical protein HFF08_01125 [Oscillospiraceae bacterium]|nr:hypothetical protein [Oscillospiraceae bacterium]